MAERAFVCKRRYEGDDLAAELAPFAEELKYAYVERMEDVALVYFEDLEDVGRWSQGRAFGPDLEIRWERDGDGYELLSLTEREDLSPSGGDWQAVEAGIDGLEERAVLLWGTHRHHLPSTHRQYSESEEVPDEWIETRIPRPLRYPVEGGPAHVRIAALDYQRQGVTVLTRFREVMSDDG